MSYPEICAVDESADNQDARARELLFSGFLPAEMLNGNDDSIVAEPFNIVLEGVKLRINDDLRTPDINSVGIINIAGLARGLGFPKDGYITSNVFYEAGVASWMPAYQARRAAFSRSLTVMGSRLQLPDGSSMMDRRGGGGRPANIRLANTVRFVDGQEQAVVEVDQLSWLKDWVANVIKRQSPPTDLSRWSRDDLSILGRKSIALSLSPKAVADKPDGMRSDYDYDTQWGERAACRRGDTRKFYPDNTTSTFEAEAKDTCRTCAVRVECLVTALKHDERYGIWGGFNPDERLDIARRA